MPSLRRRPREPDGRCIGGADESWKMLPFMVTFLVPKIRRGTFIFLAWKGDHGPRHVHVYRDGKLVVKWDLEHRCAMRGKATRRVLELIRDLEREGLL